MMNEDMKFPRPSVEKLNEYHELCQKMHDAQLTDGHRRVRPHRAV